MELNFMIRKIFFKSIFIMIIFMSFTGCSINDKSKGVFVEKWNNMYEGNNIHFYYEDKTNPSLKKLREDYKLDDSVKNSKDDFEKAMVIMKWVNNKLNFKKESVSSKQDAISILKVGKGDNTLSDKDYCIVYSQALSSLGVFSRRGEFKCKDAAHVKKDFYYKVCEFWSEKYKKWIMVDVVNNCYMEKDGQPLSALEVLDIGIENVKINGVENKEKYVKKMKKYFYSYTIAIDNNIYEDQKSNSYITYINSKEKPEIQVKDGFVPPTIFVNKKDLFVRSPKITYKDNKSDNIPTLVFSKRKNEDKKSKNIIFCGGVFKNSVMVNTYYISINGEPWKKVNAYFNVTLKEGINTIKLSENGEKTIREVVIKYIK